ncbi:MAG: hypothetical protein CVT82_11595 [Alphaproteobacteria bacterium HGW-Alphaproteobacteria-4]|jgi:DNA-binding beta-propeller fold protein YncE|nr:MAG: hypothetical protein CVT82_11595 [Alphaproteobacteria bacterium HGW-Alphaproteobacteria-4]
MKTTYTLCGISALALTAFAFAAPVAAQTPPAPPPISSLPITDVPYEQITSFEQVRLNWVRKAQEGNIGRTFDVQVIQEWPVAAPIFTPEPGKVYVYENTGRGGHADRPPEEKNTNKSNRSVILDAATHKVIASVELPPELAGSVHSTGLSPDGKYIYEAGPILTAPEGSHDPAPAPQGSILKIDALSLQPLKLFNVGGSLHHSQVIQDKWVLMDNFATRRETGGLDVMLLDPETDTILGGIRDEEMGGNVYTSWADPTGEYVYVLMEPSGFSGYSAAGQTRTADLRWIRPFWVSKVRLADWTVVQEYPYPGYRSNWIQFSPDNKFFYVDGSGDDKLIKINIETGEVVWSQATGPGPYGIEVNGDGTQVWAADKGETVSMFGRTITVINAETGKHISTLPGAYMVDHIILSPNGKEMWATSNGEGKLWIYDSDTRKLLDIVPMPGFGDAHGLTFVAYDDKGVGRVVADQGDFHGGVDPRNGKPLNY